MIVITLLVLPVVFFLAHRKPKVEHNALDRAVMAASMPVQWAVTTVLDGIQSRISRYIALVGVAEENTTLTVENHRLRAALVQREEDHLENIRLRRLLGVRHRLAGLCARTARVVATSPSPLFRSVRIDRGSASGVVLGAAVLTDEGVVGRVAALASHTADVMLLVDANSSVDVLVQRTRARARVRGLGDDVSMGLQVEYLARTADIEPGDILVTSGIGSVFAKGLAVGKASVVEQSAFGLYQDVSLVPAVNFGRLEDVLVVVAADVENDTDSDRALSGHVAEEGGLPSCDMHRSEDASHL